MPSHCTGYLENLGTRYFVESRFTQQIHTVSLNSALLNSAALLATNLGYTLEALDAFQMIVSLVESFARVLDQFSQLCFSSPSQRI